MKKNALALLVVTLLAAGSSAAMSLGRYRGTAPVGRPLDISVQAVLDAQDDPAALCIEADAFYADNKLDKSLVRVSTEKALSNPLDTIIRIRSSVPVDERVVTLMVRAGCQQKTERRYVVLADGASEPMGLPLPSSASGVGASSVQVPIPTAGNSAAGASMAPPAAASSVLPSTASPVPVMPAASTSARRNKARPAVTAATAATAATGSGEGPDALAVGQAAAARPVKDDLPVVKRDRQRVRNVGASGSGAVGKARLRLEPLDVGVDRDPQLKSSKELLSVPAADEPQRSAAAALWRALTAQPQDVLRDTEKIQSLENLLSTLRTQNQKSQLAANELASQLEKTRSERYANWLVYVLGALVMLTLAGLVYMRRTAGASGAANTNDLPWWRKNKPRDKGWTNNFQASVFAVSPPPMVDEDNTFHLSEKKEQKGRKSVRTLPGAGAAVGANNPAFKAVRQMPSVGGNSQPPPLSSFDAPVSMPHATRSVKAEALFDVQQQADFFASLSQYEQAVEVLRGHIAGDPQTSPLVYLDLFNLYHQLGRRSDYEALRNDFNVLFPGNIPAFDTYTDKSAGLDAYPVALTRIQALWPSPKVVELLEESILRRPVANTDAFDLEAYRELLLLYAVAKELVYLDGVKGRDGFRFDLPAAPVKASSAPKPGFSLTSIEPLPAIADAGISHRKAVAGQPLLLPLDVDLNDLDDTSNTALPGAGTPSNSNSNFFARLGTKLPTASSARSPAPVAPYVSPAEIDNMIDFEEFEPFIQSPDKKGPAKS